MSAIILSVVMLSVVMLSVVMLSVIMLSVIMQNVVMLNVVRLNVFMLRVVAPFQQFYVAAKNFCQPRLQKLVRFSISQKRSSGLYHKTFFSRNQFCTIVR